MRLNSATEIIQYCTVHKVPLHALSLELEVASTDKSADEIINYLKQVLHVMNDAIRDSIYDSPESIKGKIIENDGVKIKNRYETHQTVCGGTMAKAIAYALGTMTVNASMGKIVASPTAGSCGVLPAVLMTMKERFDLSEETLIEGLLVANIIGRLVAQNATIAGAEGGCQAEVGTASAMAAAAVVYMLDGDINAVFDASAICFKNLMGLICDPIAGLVESPCAKRNAIGTSNALICAEMTLAGVKSIVAFDEVVSAMYRVGKALPPAFRETSTGGLAVTKTAVQISTKLFKEV